MKRIFKTFKTRVVGFLALAAVTGFVLAALVATMFLHHPTVGTLMGWILGGGPVVSVVLVLILAGQVIPRSGTGGNGRRRGLSTESWDRDLESWSRQGTPYGIVPTNSRHYGQLPTGNRN